MALTAARGPWWRRPFGAPASARERGHRRQLWPLPLTVRTEAHAETIRRAYGLPTAPVDAVACAGNRAAWDAHARTGYLPTGGGA